MNGLSEEKTVEQSDGDTLAEAHAAILRADELASDMSERWLEEAQQASFEHDKKAERECMAKADSYTRISNALQPALGAALRARRLALSKSEPSV